MTCVKTLLTTNTSRLIAHQRQIQAGDSVPRPEGVRHNAATAQRKCSLCLVSVIDEQYIFEGSIPCDVLSNPLWRVFLVSPTYA